jgi:hypothetical protein
MERRVHRHGHPGMPPGPEVSLQNLLWRIVQGLLTLISQDALWIKKVMR